jgi:hypothetical protein
MEVITPLDWDTAKLRTRSFEKVVPRVFVVIWDQERRCERIIAFAPE